LNEISFGENVLLSWDILVMDNDFHKILNKENVQINNPKPIIFGNDIWVGCRSTILKGVTIADNNVIAAGTILSKSIPESGNVVGGNPIGVVKNDIQWQR
jgi:acetyltransferase-like isoleucine patch superfamily enzyme